MTPPVTPTLTQDQRLPFYNSPDRSLARRWRVISRMVRLPDDDAGRAGLRCSCGEETRWGMDDDRDVSGWIDRHAFHVLSGRR